MLEEFKAIEWLPNVNKIYNFKIVWPKEPVASVFRGRILNGENREPVKKFKVHLAAAGIPDFIGSVSSAKLDDDISEGVAHSGRNGPSLNTLYFRDFVTSDGVFEFGHLQPGATIDIRIYDDKDHYAFRRYEITHSEHKTIDIVLKKQFTGFWKAKSLDWPYK